MERERERFFFLFFNFHTFIRDSDYRESG